MPADQRSFLSEVRTIAGDDDLSGNLTLAAFTSQAVGQAAAGTYLASFQYGSGFFRPSRQLPAIMELLVGRYLSSSSSSFRFFPFLTTSTVTGGGKIVVVTIFLVSFLGFFVSLCRKSRFPIVTPLFEYDNRWHG